MRNLDAWYAAFDLKSGVRVSADPAAHVLWGALVKFIEISWHDEPIVPDVMPVNNGERVGLSVFNRKTSKVYVLISDCGGIALHGDASFREDLNCMRTSLRGREELVARVQQALALPTKKEAETVLETVVTALEAMLLFVSP